MALNIADRVKETSTTTGTGTLSLDGAVSKFQGFVAGIGTGNTCRYSIEHQTAAEWEVGIGTVTDATPDTLSRTTVLASSNAGALVNLSAGTKDVFVTIPAGRVALNDVDNTFTANQTISNTAPSLTLSDTTASAKDLVIVVDGDKAELRESAGAANSLITLDLTNNWLGVKVAPSVPMHVCGDTGSLVGAPSPAQIRIAGATDTNKRLYLGYDTTNNRGVIQAGIAGTGWSNLLVSPEGGNVGIGMAPSVQFELSGSVGQKASGTTWSNPSDARLKDDVRDYTDGLDVIKKIHPVHYTLNGLAGTPKGQQGISVIAQEMLSAMPYTIETYRAKLRPDDEADTELYRFEASAVIFALVNAVKELAAQVDALKAGR